MTKFKSLLAKFWKLVPSLIFVFAIFAIFSSTAFANDELLAIKTETLEWIAYIVKLISYLAYLFAILVGDLMDSSLIVDSGMGATLHLIWQVMRNFVNVAFILVLLIIAVMVIFGSGGEKGLGMLKKVLPKFVLALVLVNFTFFISRFILTTNDVLTTAVLTIPQTISPDKVLYLPGDNENGKKWREELKEKISPAGAISSASVDEAIEYLSELHEHKLENAVDKKGIMLVLTTTMIDLEHTITTKALSGNWDALLGSIGSIVTAAAVGIVVFMLFLALVVRMVVLWIVIAVSPLAALAMVLGDVIPGLNVKGDFDVLTIFIKHAFMPLLVSIPLTIGLVMIFANNMIVYNPSLSSFFSNSGSSAANNLYSLLWWIASIIVIWYGTNLMIKKSSDYAAKLTDKVHSGVNKFVGGAASTLQYVPFLPTGSLHEVASLPHQVSSRFRSASEGRASDNAHNLLKALPISEDLWNRPMSGRQLTTQARSLAQEIRKDTSKAGEAIGKHMDSLANNQGGGKAAEGTTIPEETRTAINESGVLRKGITISRDTKYMEALELIAKEADDPALRSRLKNAVQRIKSENMAGISNANMIKKENVGPGENSIYTNAEDKLKNGDVGTRTGEGKHTEEVKLAENVHILIDKKGGKNFARKTKGGYYLMGMDTGEINDIKDDILDLLNTKEENDTKDAVAQLKTKTDQLTNVLDAKHVANFLNNAPKSEAMKINLPERADTAFAPRKGAVKFDTKKETFIPS